MFVYSEESNKQEYSALEHIIDDVPSLEFHFEDFRRYAMKTVTKQTYGIY